jgi:hypothetical protein
MHTDVSKEMSVDSKINVAQIAAQSLIETVSSE